MEMVEKTQSEVLSHLSLSPDFYEVQQGQILAQMPGFEWDMQKLAATREQTGLSRDRCIEVLRAK